MTIRRTIRRDEPHLPWWLCGRRHCPAKHALARALDLRERRRERRLDAVVHGIVG